MAKHNIIGKLGEQAAIQYLQNKGYRLLASNWRYRNKEIDLIFMDQDTLVFVEVKTRTHINTQLGFEAVSDQKINHLVTASQAYLIKHQWTGYARFDLVSIVMNSDMQVVEIEHIPDGFYPPLH